MQLRIVWRIQSAVESVTACTAPAVQVGGVMAVAGRLNSPFISRRAVEYKQADKLPAGGVYACSGNHAILIGVDKPEEAMPAFPLGGLVAAWEGGLVPTSIVQPVFNLARRLGLRPEQPGGEFTTAYVLTPVLAGWHFSRPVYWAARGEDDNAPFQLEGEPVHRQGNLLVGWCSNDIITLPVWERWGVPVVWLFNHAVSENREEAMRVVPAEALASPVAVQYQNIVYAAVRFGGGRIVARDHEDLVVPEGNWVAIHPFPAREVVD